MSIIQDNDENAVGLMGVDKEYIRLTNVIRDAIMPDVTMSVRFTVQRIKWFASRSAKAATNRIKR